LPGFIENAGFMLSEADIIVIPSQEFESFGLTAIEAMLNEVPVISTDAGGLPETIGENGECGFYCSRKKPEEFSEKISYLIENKDKSIEIGRNGKIRANKLFNAQRMAKKYHDLLVSAK
jgi:glycosyltransferase involved in cell wall biosynthesis